MGKNRLAIFVSGAGSNAMNIIHYFSKNDTIEIAFVLTNNPASPIVSFAEERNIPVSICSNQEVSDPNFLKSTCVSFGVTHVVLAGYLKLIPSEFIIAYPDRIFNIHPSLLPKFGGHGMYGDNVHKAVLAQKEKETGITIHCVNEHFDEGRIIAQFHCIVSDDENLDSLKAKIHHLEHSYFPVVLEKTLSAN
jgi:phosphoribosylglycinamide formyltransferase-1